MKKTTKIHPSVCIGPTKTNRSTKFNVHNSHQPSKSICKDDLNHADIPYKSRKVNEKLSNARRSSQTTASKYQQKRVPIENSYLCEQSIKQSKKPKIVSPTKRKIVEKVPPINFKRGIRERFRKRMKPMTTDLTCGPEKMIMNWVRRPESGAAWPKKNCHH